MVSSREHTELQNLFYIRIHKLNVNYVFCLYNLIRICTIRGWCVRRVGDVFWDCLAGRCLMRICTSAGWPKNIGPDYQSGPYSIVYMQSAVMFLAVYHGLEYTH
jgi:hypothetical protein